MDGNGDEDEEIEKLISGICELAARNNDHTVLALVYQILLRCSK